MKTYTPLPADMCRDHTNKDRRQERSSKETGVCNGHAHTALVNEIEIADASIDKCFKGCQCNSLKNTTPQQARIVMVCVCRTTPRRSRNHQESPQ